MGTSRKTRERFVVFSNVGLLPILAIDATGAQQTQRRIEVYHPARKQYGDEHAMPGAEQHVAGHRTTTTANRELLAQLRLDEKIDMMSGGHLFFPGIFTSAAGSAANSAAPSRRYVK
jgi:hypothetical protein